MDTIWYGMEQNISAEEVAKALGLKTEQVENVMADIKRKIAGTEYLRANPI